MTNSSDIFTHDLTSDLDFANVTMDYNVTSGYQLNFTGSVFDKTILSTEETRVLQLIGHYNTIARNIWRIWSPIAIGKLTTFSLYWNQLKKCSVKLLIECLLCRISLCPYSKQKWDLKFKRV